MKSARIPGIYAGEYVNATLRTEAAQNAESRGATVVVPEDVEKAVEDMIDGPDA